MKTSTIRAFKKGWFIGDFTPTIIPTNEVEVAVKHYKAGDSEAAHYHKIATEITVIISGEVEMNGHRFGTNDIIIIEPGEKTDFKCLTDVVTTVVKYPGASNDKYTD